MKQKGTQQINTEGYSSPVDEYHMHQAELKHADCNCFQYFAFLPA